MKTAKLSLSLFTLLVVATCLLLFSTHSKHKNYVLEGKVKVQPKGSPVSLPVYVTQSEKLIRDYKDFEKLHRVYTEEGGKFITEFHAEVNTPIHFYVVKEGITPVRHTFTPNAIKGDRQVLEEPILFTALHEQLKSSHHYGDRGMPELPTFDGECEPNPSGRIPVDQIVFVENLQLISCINSPLPKLTGGIKTLNDYFANEFFSHQLKVGPHRAVAPNAQRINEE